MDTNLRIVNKTGITNNTEVWLGDKKIQVTKIEIHPMTPDSIVEVTLSMELSELYINSKKFEIKFVDEEE